MKQLAPGPLMIDIAGTRLDDLDRERLCHQLVGGMILFFRNYENPGQLAALTGGIRPACALRTWSPWIMKRGGVQRFREGFTRLPAMAALGRLSDRQGPGSRAEAARRVGYVLAAGLPLHAASTFVYPGPRSGAGPSRVIGDHAFIASRK